MKRLLAAVVLSGLTSCHSSQPPGWQELPPGIPNNPSSFVDFCPRWSHDGKQIAFLRRFSDRRLQLFIASSDLNTIKPVGAAEVVTPDRDLVTGRDSARTSDGIAWSPDDRSIAIQRLEWFVRPGNQRIPGTSIWARQIEDAGFKALAVHPADYGGWLFYYRAPVWSPDGKRIAFIGEGLRGESGILLRPLAGADVEWGVSRYDQYEDTEWPAWSPDGRYLAFRQRVLRSVTADPVETIVLREPAGRVARTLFKSSDWQWNGGKLQNRSASSTTLSNWQPQVTGISWSPGGRSLAVSFHDSFDRSPESSLWVLRPLEVEAPSTTAMVWSGEGRLSDPVWIDERAIGALVTMGGRPTNTFSAVRIDVTNGKLTRICRLPSDDFDWSPDRKTIAIADSAIPSDLRKPMLRCIRTSL